MNRDRSGLTVATAGVAAERQPLACARRRRPRRSVVWIVGTLLVAPAASRADLLSPGPLARAHRGLEGLENCTKCHEAGEELSDRKCLACHEEVGRRLQAGEGLHGRLPAGERACASCHKDHHDDEQALAGFGPAGKDGFAHARTGWPLEGEHRKVKCEPCHDARLVADADVRAWIAEHPKEKTWLGLSTSCATCHFDEHRGQEGDRCESCHDAADWKRAPKFDHDETEFALRGRHRKVGCTECHEVLEDETTAATAFPSPKSFKFLQLDDVPHAACTDCHDDPHAGKYGPRCQSCHSEDGWLKLRGLATAPAFHEKTRFPLRGEHVDVPCKSCHGPLPGMPTRFKGLAFEACADCHLDAHLGQLVAEGGKPQACDGCHAVEGFLPARFEAADHDRTGYPLDGAHRTVACSACHATQKALARRLPQGEAKLRRRQKRPVQVSLVAFDLPRAKGGACKSCHDDVHRGQFDARVADTGCEGCHTSAASFAEVTFDHGAETDFALEGAHAEAACGSCHLPDRKGTVRYAGLETACASCHDDVHVGQLAAEDGTTDCAVCHDARAFVPAPGFRHEPPLASFVLDGAHATAPCESCHAEVELAKGAKTRRYEGLPTECEGCHRDFHQGTFEGFQP